MSRRRQVPSRVIITVAVSLMIAALSTACAKSGAGSSSGKVYQIKFIDSNANTTPQVKSDMMFKKLVEKSSGGRIKVTVYPNGVLAATDKEVGSVASNVTQMTENSVVPLAQYTAAFNFFQIPMIFNDPQQISKGFKSKAVANLGTQFQKKSGVRILAWQELGWVQFMNSVRDVSSPGDVKGLKFRIIPGSDPLQTTLNLLGAQPVPLAYSETYTAAQAGTVNANEEPPTIFAGDKEYEILKHLTMLNFQYNPNPVMMNEKFYESLPTDLQKDVDAAATQAAAAEVKDVDSTSASTVKMFQRSGVRVTQLTDAQRQRFVDAIKPYLKSTITHYDPALFTAFGVDTHDLSA